jgi:hypothetical protein
MFMDKPIPLGGRGEYPAKALSKDGEDPSRNVTEFWGSDHLLDGSDFLWHQLLRKVLWTRRTIVKTTALMSLFPPMVSCRRNSKNAKDFSERKDALGMIDCLEESCLLLAVRKTTIRERNARHLQHRDNEAKNGKKLFDAPAKSQDFVL